MNTIDLNKYLSISAEGYDGYGTLEAEVDWDAIREKYGDKIKYTDYAKKEIPEENMPYIDSPAYAMQDNISVELSQTDNLTNGTEVTYTWKVPDELFKYIKPGVKFKNGTYKVNGLQKVKTFDAFADLKVSFEGTEPNGSVKLEYEGDGLSEADFSCENRTGLSNGDKSLVTMDDSNVTSYLDRCGSIPKKFEKEYTVSGLECYVRKISEIDDEALEAMKKQAIDVHNADVASNWGEDTRWKIALVLSGLATIASLVSLFTNASYDIESNFMLVTFFGALGAYLLTGGILTAIKWAWNIGKAAWFIVLIFPIDLLLGLFGLVYGFVALFCFPILVVGKRYMDRQKGLTV